MAQDIGIEFTQGIESKTELNSIIIQRLHFRPELEIYKL